VFPGWPAVGDSYHIATIHDWKRLSSAQEREGDQGGAAARMQANLKLTRATPGLTEDEFACQMRCLSLQGEVPSGCSNAGYRGVKRAVFQFREFSAATLLARAMAQTTASAINIRTTRGQSVSISVRPRDSDCFKIRPSLL
jgi:hypothetical protein